VSTGVYIDGLIDNSKSEFDFEEEDNEHFERVLTALATQIPIQESSEATQPTLNFRGLSMATQSQHLDIDQELATETAFHSNSMPSSHEQSDGESEDDFRPSTSMAETATHLNGIESATPPEARQPLSFPSFGVQAQATELARASGEIHDNNARVHSKKQERSTPKFVWLMGQWYLYSDRLRCPKPE
jgi:hypothetical protein